VVRADVRIHVESSSAVQGTGAIEDKRTFNSRSTIAFVLFVRLWLRIFSRFDRSIALPVDDIVVLSNELWLTT
jgi:hypothetical protein